MLGSQRLAQSFVSAVRAMLINCIGSTSVRESAIGEFYPSVYWSTCCCLLT